MRLSRGGDLGQNPDHADGVCKCRELRTRYTQSYSDSGNRLKRDGKLIRLLSLREICGACMQPKGLFNRMDRRNHSIEQPNWLQDPEANGLQVTRTFNIKKEKVKYYTIKRDLLWKMYILWVLE